MISHHQRLLRTSVAAASLILFASAGTAVAKSPAAAFDLGPPSVLKRLPGGQDDFLFRGEVASRGFSLYLSGEEAKETKAFQLGLRNAIALLPGRSSIKLSINGRDVATLPVDSAKSVSLNRIEIPDGLLAAGRNTIRMDAVMAHRVDCSVDATYELWTRLDPSVTGFVVPGSAIGPIGSIEDVAGEPMAEDGTTRILLRMDGTDAPAVDRAARFVQALVRRAGLARPIVELGSKQGRGPGFDIVFTTDRNPAALSQGSKVVGREGPVSFSRDPHTNRLVLTVAGHDEADLDAAVTNFASKASQRPMPATDAVIHGDQRVSFAELGLGTLALTGRHVETTLGVALPADVYLADYAKVRMLVDATYSADLDPDSSLIVKVNGALASSLRLGPDRSGVLQHESLELPLRMFHPGHNDITIEAITTNKTDRHCNMAAPSEGVRFTLAESSEFDFPYLARLGTSPQIPGALAAEPRTRQSELPIYVAGQDNLSIGSGLTVMTNLVAGEAASRSPVLRMGLPTASDIPGIVVAPWRSLPDSLTTSLKKRLQVEDGFELRTSLDESAPNASGIGAMLRRALTKIGLGSVNLHTELLADRGRRLLRSAGFVDGTDAPRTVPFTARTLLVAAVDPGLEDRRIAGIDVPAVVDRVHQWVIVSASGANILRSGIERMASDGRWQDLQGQALSLDVDTGAFAAVQPDRVRHVLPERLALADVRPILGGIVSDNIELSLAVLVALMTLLGISTHVLVRRSGAK